MITEGRAHPANGIGALPQFKRFTHAEPVEGRGQAPRSGRRSNGDELNRWSHP